MRTRLTTTLATAALGLAVLATPASAAHEGAVYTANLNQLNDSGASGSATVTVSDDGETMTVQVNASGLAAFPHAQHIHGIVSGDTVEASFCPPASADANGDGVIDVAEGAPSYGGVQVSLTTEGDTSADSALAVERYPSGDISYTRSGIAIPDELKPDLGKLHIVVHGVDENDDGELTMDQEERSTLTDDLPREATLPALCGTLAATASTVQTGLGGAASSDGTTTGAFVLGGMLALAGAGAALRRRGEQA